MTRLIMLLCLIAAATVGCIKLPAGLHVNESTTGCTTSGTCPYTDGKPHNWYDATTREIVVAPGQSLKVWAHEACHAHQHQTILDETGKEPRLVVSAFNPTARIADLHEWHGTDEGKAYAAVVEQAGPNPWGMHYTPLLEDFAEACGRFLTDWGDLDPVRAQFFDERGFR